VQHLPQARVGGRDVRQPGACGGPRRAPGPVRYRMAGLTAQIYCHNLDATSARPALSSPPLPVTCRLTAVTAALSLDTVAHGWGELLAQRRAEAAAEDDA